MALFEFEGNEISQNDFIEAIKKVGIEAGDHIFVHSDITVFGSLITTDRKYLLNSLVDSLKQVVGEDGTVIMPCFTYSFRRNQVFDKEKTKSTVGVLTEFFRKSPGVERTGHPLFSCAVYGKNKEFFLNVGKDSFGSDSIFGRMQEKGGKILFLGAPFQRCTHIHYVEQFYGIPYRYMETFKGETLLDGKIVEDTASQYVRDVNKNVVLLVDKLEDYLLKNGFLKKVSLGNSNIQSISTEDLLKEGCRLLDQDIYYFLKEKP